MKLDLDDLLELTDPWDLVVTVGGIDYATRRPTVAEIDALRQVATMPPETLQALIGSLFFGGAGNAPDLSSWTSAQLLHFLGGYLAYFRQRLSAQKKNDPVELAIRAIEAQQTRGGRGGREGNAGTA